MKVVLLHIVVWQLHSNQKHTKEIKNMNISLFYIINKSGYFRIFICIKWKQSYFLYFFMWVTSKVAWRGIISLQILNWNSNCVPIGSNNNNLYKDLAFLMIFWTIITEIQLEEKVSHQLDEKSKIVD